MTSLDIKTLYFAYVLTSLLLGLFQLGMWRLRPREPALLIWGFSNLAAALGNSLLSLRGVIPDPISISIANSLLFYSYALMWAGLRRFQDQTVPWRLVVLSPFFLGLLYQFLWLEPESLGIRVLVHSVAVSVYCVACFADAVSAQRIEPLAMRRVAMTSFALVFGLMAVRMSLNSTIAIGSYIFPGGPNPNGIFVTMTLFLSMLWNLAIIFMTAERLENSLSRLAHRDVLTQLLNRTGFQDLAHRQIKRSVHAGEPVSVLIMDLDHFKSVNDTHGHAAGDHLLAAFAKCAHSAVRPSDLLSRHGGEEFCALLQNSQVQAAERVAERIRMDFEKVHILHGGVAVKSTVSIGVAEIHLPEESLEHAIQRADKALYEAKLQGRNRVVTAQQPATLSGSSLNSG